MHVSIKYIVAVDIWFNTVIHWSTAISILLKTETDMDNFPGFLAYERKIMSTHFILTKKMNVYKNWNFKNQKKTGI